MSPLFEGILPGPIAGQHRIGLAGSIISKSITQHRTALVTFHMNDIKRSMFQAPEFLPADVPAHLAVGTPPAANLIFNGQKYPFGMTEKQHVKTPPQPGASDHSSTWMVGIIPTKID
jgi:hypothetical protein